MTEQENNSPQKHYFKASRCMSKRDLHAFVLGNTTKALDGISISEQTPAEVSVNLVDSPQGLRLITSILLAKDAISMQSQNPSESPSKTEKSDTNSAQSVPEPRFDLLLPTDEPVSSSVKCGPCDRVTEHLVFKIVPQGIEEELDPLKALELSKRLLFCTNCANMRLIN